VDVTGGVPSDPTTDDGMLLETSGSIKFRPPTIAARELMEAVDEAAVPVLAGPSPFSGPCSRRSLYICQESQKLESDIECALVQSISALH
jgi:hypothetical protein